MSLKGKKSHATSTICTWAASLLYPSQGPSLSLKTDDALIMFLSIFSYSRGVIALLPQIVFIGKECIAEAFQGSIFIFPASISSPRCCCANLQFLLCKTRISISQCEAESCFNLQILYSHHKSLHHAPTFLNRAIGICNMYLLQYVWNHAECVECTTSKKCDVQGIAFFELFRWFGGGVVNPS